MIKLPLIHMDIRFEELRDKALGSAVDQIILKILVEIFRLKYNKVEFFERIKC